ncbi:MAG: MBL fold metallo-hydrolase [Firmicutes bacterium]|nr:MBL fold metallo-hydrolase [Bacillota bacterium]
MKKRISVILLILILSFTTMPIYAQGPVKVKVDGNTLNFDVNPQVINGRTLVPVRAIFEALGVKVGWNGKTRTVIGTKEDIKIELPISSKIATKNGKQIQLDTPATIIEGRTLVPARFIAESIGAKVGWNGTTRTVLITSNNKNNKMSVHFIDVGQADSIFIDNGDYDILIDAGNNGDGDLVVDYLKRLETDDIEVMVATHAHEDHIGGLDTILQAFKVENIVDSGQEYSSKTYEDYIDAAKSEKNSNFIEDKDMSFDMGNNAVFKIIETGDGYENTNDNSVISMLDYKDIEILFTGDMEDDIETEYLHKFSDIDVLKVGHHGSKTSSSDEFLNVIKPEYAVISVGEDNRYGHPDSELLDKLNSRDIKVYRTDEQGNVIATINGKTVTFNTEPVKIKGQDNNKDNSQTTNESTDVTKEVSIQNIDLSKEIVTIKNTTTNDINMTGWKLVSVKGNQTYEFPNGFILKAGTTVQIVSGRGAEGDGSDKLKWSGAYIWNNDGDPGELYDNSGSKVSEYDE